MGILIMGLPTFQQKSLQDTYNFIGKNTLVKILS